MNINILAGQTPQKAKVLYRVGSFEFQFARLPTKQVRKSSPC